MKTSSEADAPEPAVAATGTRPANGCGHDADDKSETARETEAPEPVGAASGKFADCHSMAARFALGSASGAIGGCRGMFEQFMGASSTVGVQSAGCDDRGRPVREGGLTMTTIATIAVPVADSWQITVGGGWIVVMLIGMALCFAAMFAFMFLMRDVHGWPMCGFRSPQDTTRRDIAFDTPVGTLNRTAGSSGRGAGR